MVRPWWALFAGSTARRHRGLVAFVVEEFDRPGGQRIALPRDLFAVVPLGMLNLLPASTTTRWQGHGVYSESSQGVPVDLAAQLLEPRKELVEAACRGSMPGTFSMNTAAGFKSRRRLLVLAGQVVAGVLGGLGPVMPADGAKPWHGEQPATTWMSPPSSGRSSVERTLTMSRRMRLTSGTVDLVGRCGQFGRSRPRTRCRVSGALSVPSLSPSPHPAKRSVTRHIVATVRVLGQ